MTSEKMSFDQFKDTLEYREKSIFIPALKAGIDKVQYITPEGYDFERQEEAIKYAYKVYLDK